MPHDAECQSFSLRTEPARLDIPMEFLMPSVLESLNLITGIKVNLKKRSGGVRGGSVSVQDSDKLLLGFFYFICTVFVRVGSI